MRLHTYQRWEKSYRLPLEHRINLIYRFMPFKDRPDWGFKRLTPVLRPPLKAVK